MENPSGASTMKLERMQIGATTDGMIAERQLPRNRKFTRATRATEMAMVIHTSWIAWEVKTELSTAMVSRVPAGRLRLMSATAARMPLEISRSLAWDWRAI